MGDAEFLHEMPNTRIRNILNYLDRNPTLPGARIWSDLMRKELTKRGQF